jgi:NAD(P)H-flavin reductase
VVDGKPQTRYFSPTSPPQHVGRVELVMRFETSGIMSKFFVNLKPGESV